MPLKQKLALLEPSRRVRQHGVDLAGVGGQVIARHSGAAVAARHVVEQAFELMDVVLDGLPEFRIAAVFVANLLERPLALRGVELAAAEAAFAALIALPQLGG